MTRRDSMTPTNPKRSDNVWGILDILVPCDVGFGFCIRIERRKNGGDLLYHRARQRAVLTRDEQEIPGYGYHSPILLVHGRTEAADGRLGLPHALLFEGGEVCQVSAV